MNWGAGHDLRFGEVFERSRVELDDKFFQPAEFTFTSLTNLLAGRLGDQDSKTPDLPSGRRRIQEPS